MRNKRCLTVNWLKEWPEHESVSNPDINPSFKLQILLEIYKDLRDEIKRRVDERNKYFVQAIMFFGALLAVGYTGKREYAISALVAGPWLSLLFLFLIYRSFTIGENIKLYLKHWVEPSLLNMSNVPTWQIFREEFRKNNPACALESKLSNIISFLVLAFLVPIIFLYIGISNYYSDLSSTGGLIAVVVNGILWLVIVCVMLILRFLKLFLCTYCELRR